MTPWCETYVPMPAELGGGLVPCKMPSAASYRFRCRWGHVLTRAACAHHDPVPGNVGCWECKVRHDREEPMTWEVVEVAAGPSQ